MSVRAAGKPGQYLLSIARIYARTLKLRKSFPAAAILPTPLYSYRLCFANVQETLTIVQLFLSLVFGTHSVTLPRPITHCDRSPVRSNRYRSFRFGRYREQNHEIDEPRDGSVKHSRHLQQGRGDILRTRNHVSFLGLGYVPCGEGEVLCTGVRV